LLELMRHTPAQGVLFLAPPAVALAAYLTGDTSSLGTAEALIQSILSSPSRPKHHVIPSLVARSLMAVQRSDLPECRVQYQALVSHPGITLVGSTLAVTDRMLGLLARTLGKMDTAREHLAGALAYCRKSGNRPELAWTCLDYADTLLRGNAPGNPSSAAALLEESLAIARDLGMRPLMDRIASLQDQSRSRPAETPGYPHGLSTREVEVLRRIAMGKTDREIAQDLVISSRTVNNHVRSILNKTAASNRTEAAAYAVLIGLTRPSDRRLSS
jgi:DNA-binding NarL/FixJ family response regulator